MLKKLSMAALLALAACGGSNGADLFDIKPGDFKDLKAGEVTGVWGNDDLRVSFSKDQVTYAVRFKHKDENQVCGITFAAEIKTNSVVAKEDAQANFEVEGKNICENISVKKGAEVTFQIEGTQMTINLNDGAATLQKLKNGD